MKYILIIAIYVAAGLLCGCTDLKLAEDSPELKAAKAAEDARYQKGPTRKAGCYKVINKKSSRYGCTFQSTQGSMFVGIPGGQHPGRRDYEGDSALSAPATWQLIWNRKIRCLDDHGFFVPEEDVKPIKCPEYLYH